MLDKDDQKSMADKGGKGGTSSGSKSGGGKMGASSSQTGGTKSSASSGAKSTSTGSKTSGMGSRSANAATGPKGYGGDTSGTGLGGTRSGPGGAGGVRNTSTGTRQADTSSRVGGTIRSNPSVAAGGNTLGGGLLSSSPAPASRVGGLVPTPRDHPFRDPSRFNYPQTYAGAMRTTELQRQALASGLSLPDQLAQGVPARNLSMLANLQSAYGKPLGLTSVASQGHAKRSQHHGGVLSGAPGSEIANAFDTEVLGGPAERAKVAQLARDIGFTGIGTYDGPFSGAFRDMVHVDTGPTRSWGATAKAATRGYQPDNPDMGAIAARVAAGSPTYGGLAPSLAAAATPPAKVSPEIDPRSRALPQPKPSDLASAVAARNTLANLGVNPGRAFPGAPTPNMDMSGYRSPMSGLSGMPPAPSNMDMGGYNSPMAGVGGMPQANPGGMGNYGSPMTGLTGMPNVPANMDMGGYRSPMAGVGNLPAPRNPESGMSFTPGMPRNPVSGMSFNPPAPRNSIGGMSFNPALPGQMPGPERSRSPFVDNAPQQVAQSGNRPRALGLENYQGPGYANPPRSFANIPASGFPQQQKEGGFFAGLGDAVNNLKSAVQAPVEQAKKVASLAYDNLNNPLLGLVREPGPNNPHVAGGEGRPLRGGDGGQMWTGRESPRVVSQMQQHVEDVLRQYFIAQSQGIA